MSEEQSIFDVLPGERLPVSKVMETLSTMWQVPFQEGVDTPSGFRASQMNIVVHFGLKTTLEEALNTFNIAIGFAQRYPCRLIVLCPRGREVSEKLLDAKLFSQCYIGETMRDMCCCEALMLGYPTRVAGFLDNQVSIWLESDLPTYHWFHRVPAKRIEEIHMGFIRRCRRVIYDSTVEHSDYANIPWENPYVIKDLAYARLLPVRQSLGQFFSSFEPEVILGGLKKVTVGYDSKRFGEAHGMLAWLQACLSDCAQQAGITFQVEFDSVEGCEKKLNCLELNWEFEDGAKEFSWGFCQSAHTTSIVANFGNGQIQVPLQVRFLEDEKALSEALFFS